MEDLLKSFTTGYILRTLSGVFFVLSYRVATLGWFEAIDLHPSSEDWLFALFAGVFCYTLYRSGLYALLIESTFDCPRFRKWRDSQWRFIREDTMKRLLDRWRRKSPTVDANAIIAKHCVTWADYTHLMYASAACILFGAIAGSSIRGWSKVKFDLPLTAIGGGVFLLAYISDWRLRAIEDYAANCFPLKAASEARSTAVCPVPTEGEEPDNRGS